jgi:hypothetical protein
MTEIANTGNDLQIIAQEMVKIRKQLTEVIGYIREAESEIPEKIRRFGMHMNTIHDAMDMYKELGQPVPKYILREVERCDDRMRQLLNEVHAEGGAFAKIRAEMAKDTENRWDHTRLLTKGPNP